MTVNDALWPLYHYHQLFSLLLEVLSRIILLVARKTFLTLPRSSFREEFNAICVPFDRNMHREE